MCVFVAHASELEHSDLIEHEASVKASFQVMPFYHTPDRDTWQSISEPGHAQKLGAKFSPSKVHPRAPAERGTFHILHEYLLGNRVQNLWDSCYYVSRRNG